jgi:hypothetical protein
MASPLSLNKYRLDCENHENRSGEGGELTWMRD